MSKARWGVSYNVDSRADSLWEYWFRSDPDESVYDRILATYQKQSRPRSHIDRITALAALSRAMR